MHYLDGSGLIENAGVWPRHFRLVGLLIESPRVKVVMCHNLLARAGFAPLPALQQLSCQTVQQAAYERGVRACYTLIPTMSTEMYREGAVEFHLPRSERVFYNPRARLGRDLGVLAMRAEAERLERPLEVLELMAGLGLRTRRYLAEAPVAHIVVNDANYDAFAYLQATLQSETRAELYNELAQRLLARFYLEDRRFDWVDLDPFGSPSPFVPWTTGVIRWGGLLYVTATDAPVLCGAQRGEALKSYDAVSALGREVPRVRAAHSDWLPTKAIGAGEHAWSAALQPVRRILLARAAAGVQGHAWVQRRTAGLYRADARRRISRHPCRGASTAYRTL
jgi:hypothetical protein